MRIVKSITFDAAHFLADPQGSPVNERPYARLHGHSFTMEAAIEGDPDPVTGWVVDFAQLGEALESLRAELDHRLLNEIEGLSQPTLENLCRFAAARLAPRFKGLVQIKVARPSIGEACIFDARPSGG